jgi:hypothetical protein
LKWVRKKLRLRAYWFVTKEDFYCKYKHKACK